MNNQISPLSKTTIFLHWLVAVTIIGLLGLGIYMEEFNAYGLYDIHKSIGALIFIVILVRVIWRIKQGWPSAAGNYKQIEHLMSKITHYVLLIGSVLIPISGLMMTYGGGHELAIFGAEVMGANLDTAGEQVARSEMVDSLGDELHGTVSYVLIGALVLHIVGAFKHHIIDKDLTLKRMLGKS